MKASYLVTYQEKDKTIDNDKVVLNFGNDKPSDYSPGEIYMFLITALKETYNLCGYVVILNYWFYEIISE